ncbi:TPA: hypothetical protein ACU207_002324 [Mannheimia haemolytica]
MITKAMKPMIYPMQYGLSDEFVISNHAENSQHFRMARNADLRTAIDEAMKEMRGLNNATTN